MCRFLYRHIGRALGTRVIRSMYNTKHVLKRCEQDWRHWTQETRPVCKYFAEAPVSTPTGVGWYGHSLTVRLCPVWCGIGRKAVGMIVYRPTRSWSSSHGPCNCARHLRTSTQSFPGYLRVPHQVKALAQAPNAFVTMPGTGGNSSGLAIGLASWWRILGSGNQSI